MDEMSAEDVVAFLRGVGSIQLHAAIVVRDRKRQYLAKQSRLLPNKSNNSNTALAATKPQ